MSLDGLINPLVNWLPVLVLVGVFLVYAARSQAMLKGQNGKSHGQMLEEHIFEMRRQNDMLESVVRDQELRLQKLETARRATATNGTTVTATGAGNGASRVAAP